MADRTLRVLTVDDDQTVGRVIERILSAGGYAVQTVECAEAAQPILRSEALDVIIIDIRMPGMDGRDLYRWMLREAPHQVEKVAFLTGSVLAGELESFLKESGRPVIHKPFDLHHLVATVKLVAR
jgi:CheY-like chemotaxis protein